MTFDTAQPSLLSKPEPLTGAAALAIEEQAAPPERRAEYTRTRASRADSAWQEAKRILDAPIPGSGSPSAEVQRAQARAAIREREAAILAPSVYGKREAVDVRLVASVCIAGQTGIGSWADPVEAPAIVRPNAQPSAYDADVGKGKG